jgi:hypothetical protein
MLKDGEIVVELSRGWVNASDYGALGTSDDAAVINAALADAGSDGGGTVLLPIGTFLIGTSLSLPDNVTLMGFGRGVTTIKLKNSGNVDLIIRHANYTGLNAAIRHLTIDGNEASNTQGGVYWAGPNNQHGPTLTIEDVRITGCEHVVGGGALNAAVLLEGSAWGVLRDVDIFENSNVVGLWHKGSDWVFDQIFASTNGNAGPHQSVIVQGGAGNRFFGSYFGGNGGLEQVLLWGSSRNDFVGCYNDNAWREAYKLISFGGNGSNDNRFTGGQVTSPSQKTNNTYDAFRFEDSSGNIVSGITIDNLTATKGRYAASESGTSNKNLIVGCVIGRTAAFATGVSSLTGANSSLTACIS